jgi:hypothetical protein
MLYVTMLAVTPTMKAVAAIGRVRRQRDVGASGTREAAVSLVGTG